MIKKKYKIVFVVLVYKNTQDIIDFIKSVQENIEDVKIVIVDAFYSNEVSDRIDKIAGKYDTDVIHIENKGYGYGNNKGIEYVHNNYEYSNLIIANPDTIIKKLDYNCLRKINNGIIGPKIVTKNRKNQNPYWYANNRLGEALIYQGCKRNKKILRYVAYIINKVIREIYILWFKYIGKDMGKVFAVHGSFVIFTKSAIEKLMPLYDENMFLFAEEAYLAHRAKEKGIKTYYTENVEVLHKEDGSMAGTNINEEKIYKESIIYYYEKFH